MALTVTDNSVQQINAALLSLQKEIEKLTNEKSQDNKKVQIEIENVQYSFMSPLKQHGTTISVDTTGTWEGNATSATNAEYASEAGTATNADITKTLDITNGDKLQIGTGAAINVTNAKHAANGVPTYSVSDAAKHLAVNSGGTGIEWVKPQKIKIADYRTGSLTWTSVGQQQKVELSNFGSDVTESNVLCFMVIYWSGVKTIAEADWAQSQGTGSSGMACALTALGTGSGYSVIRCVYLV
jgi:hypothetical protein